jgi:hypothetical protein
MSKETADRGANTCACGQVIAFPAYHWPHCPANPKNLHPAIVKVLPFTKAELATIAMQGPVADKPIGRKKGKR